MSKDHPAYYGRIAEEAAARKYGLERVGRKWYDAKYKSNGKKVQIKACRRQYSDGRTGKFRFWLRDHRLIQKYNGSYVCVLYNPDASQPIQKIKKISPQKVEREATWYTSNHESKGKQAEIQYPRLL